MKNLYVNYEFNEILNAIKANAGTRKIIVWGYGDYQNDLEEFLKDFNIEVYYYLDVDKALLYENVKSIEEYIKVNHTKEHYLIVTALYNPKILQILKDNKLINLKDYIYCTHAPIKVELEENYKDGFGNTVLFSEKLSDSHVKLTVNFKGYNSKIVIGKNFKTTGKVEIICDSDSQLEVGDDVTMNGDTKWYLYKCSQITIEKGCSMAEGMMHTFRNASINMGANTVIGKNHFIVAHIHTKISIGKDCVLGTDLHLRTNDGHTIFDIDSKEPINVSLEKNKTIHMVISDHIWIGTRVVMVGNSKIGKGSVVGACSFVKGDFPNNATIAGVPAKVIRKNIAWSRANFANNIEIINSDYIEMTIE